MSEGGRAVRYYNPRLRQVLTSRNVIFPSPKAPPLPQVSEVPSPRLEGENEPSAPHAQDKTSPPPEDIFPNAPKLEDNATGPTDDVEPIGRRSKRNATPAHINYRAAAGYQVQKHKDSVNNGDDEAKTHFVETCFHSLTDEPQSVREVKNSERRWEFVSGFDNMVI